MPLILTGNKQLAGSYRAFGQTKANELKILLEMSGLKMANKTWVLAGGCVTVGIRIVDQFTFIRIHACTEAGCAITVTVKEAPGYDPIDRLRVKFTVKSQQKLDAVYLDFGNGGQAALERSEDGVFPNTINYTYDEPGTYEVKVTGVTLDLAAKELEPDIDFADSLWSQHKESSGNMQDVFWSHTGISPILQSNTGAFSVFSSNPWVDRSAAIFYSTYSSVYIPNVTDPGHSSNSPFWLYEANTVGGVIPLEQIKDYPSVKNGTSLIYVTGVGTTWSTSHPDLDLPAPSWMSTEGNLDLSVRKTTGSSVVQRILPDTELVSMPIEIEYQFNMLPTEKGYLTKTLDARPGGTLKAVDMFILQAHIGPAMFVNSKIKVFPYKCKAEKTKTITIPFEEE